MPAKGQSHLMKQVTDICRKRARATSFPEVTRSGSLSLSNHFVLHPMSGQTGILPESFAACATPAKLFIAAMMTSALTF
jgi:hypothetical protein